MQRPNPQIADAPSHDSFLDIVANIVGILIILVMVTGVRAKNLPATPPLDEHTQAAAAALEKDHATEASLWQDELALQERVRDLQREKAARQEERARLATAVAAWTQEIDSARNRLDADAQADFDLSRKLADAASQLDRLRHDAAMAETARQAPIMVESYPTPISTTVDDGEIHFQLRAGRLVFIPLQPLLERLKRSAQHKARDLLDLPEVTDTVGPIGGFRLKYTLERHDVSIEMQMASGSGSAFARLKRWTLIPTSGQLGELVDDALTEGSRFRSVLSEHRPDQTTITIWTYPDSFAEFRRLKKVLYHAGFLTAARPLPPGAPIAGSPQGTKSAAQ